MEPLRTDDGAVESEPRLGEQLAAETPCPYAGTARYASYKLECREDLEPSATALRNFARRRKLHRTTAFVVLCDPEVHGEGPYGLARLFRTVVHLANDTETDRVALYRRITAPDWRLPIARAEFFAVVLSPVYPTGHQRHCGVWSSLLFQPEALFEAQGITTNNNRPVAYGRALRAFSRRGVTLAGSLHLGRVPKAYRTVLTEDGEVGLPWWVAPLLTERAVVSGDSSAQQAVARDVTTAARRATD